MLKNLYYTQARLVLQLLPFVMKHDHFALKGGTAINFFVRNLPRLSIDIDLTYVPIEDRKTSIQNISDSLNEISESLQRVMRNVKVVPKILPESNLCRGLVIGKEGIMVKIEPNPIIRGTVYPCQVRDLSKDAEDLFEFYVSVQTLSFADLFGGKICAALDRQHPRDLFDVKLLFDHEEFTDEIRKAFIVYLISHNRPIHELLDPGLVDTRNIFENEFLGMTRIEVKYEELVETRRALILKIKNGLSDNEKKFLMSIKRVEPTWDLLGLEGVEHLPAVRWKLMNLERMSKAKRQQALQDLKKVLDL
jgi:hypothetical protein